MLDAFDKGTAPGAPHLPPCLVTDAGDYSLAEWPMKRARWVACSGMLHLSVCQIKTSNMHTSSFAKPAETFYKYPSALRCLGEGVGSLTGHCHQCMLATEVRGQRV